jgi:hypothetical protein
MNRSFLSLALALLSALSLVSLSCVTASPATEPGAAAPVSSSTDARKTEKADVLAGMEFHRILLHKPESQAQEPLPYSLEVPTDWAASPFNNNALIILGRPGQVPAEVGKRVNPNIVTVRSSQVDLAKPEEVVATIKANSATDPDWKVSLVEVKEVGGVRGILVRSHQGEGDAARTTLILKLPLKSGSIDFIAQARPEEFDAHLPLYERVLYSIQPVESGN